MPADWVTSDEIPITKGNGNITNCDMYWGEKLLEHAMKIAENVFLERVMKILKIDDMQFVYMPGRGAIDAVFILKRMHEEYLSKQKKFYMCLVDLKNAFGRVPRKVVEWAMRRKVIPETLVEQLCACVRAWTDDSFLFLRPAYPKCHIVSGWFGDYIEKRGAKC